MNLSRSQKITAAFVALAAIAAAGWIATGDSGPKFRGTPRVVATLVLEAPNGEPLGGYATAIYRASSGDSRCSRTPRAFGIFPQASATSLSAQVRLLPLETSGATTTYQAIEASDSRCRWRFFEFVAHPTVSGKEVRLSLMGAGLSSRKNLTARLSCTAPYSPAFPRLPCVDYDPDKPTLHQLNLNFKRENQP